MDRTTLLTTVTAIVKDCLGFKELELEEATIPKDVERWDSVANIGIIMGIEQEFGFRFALGELDSIETVGDILDAIIRHA